MTAASTPESTPAALTVFGATWCADCRRSKRLLDRLGVAYVWVDLEREPGRLDEALSRTGGVQVIPVVVFPDGSHLVEPSDPALTERLTAAGLLPG